MAAKKYNQGSVTYFKRGNTWTAYWRQNGIRKWKSLKCENLHVAKIKAKELNDAIEGGTIE